MNQHKRGVLWFLALVAAVTFAMAAIGCGGGGSDNPQADSGGSGTVALYLTDAPTDAFDRIWIEITEISLFCGDDGPPHVVFQTDDPQPIDLLSLRDGDTQLIGVDQQIPVGTYTKIRLDVRSIEGEKDGDTTTFNLPSGKIDLDPQQDIVVEDGQSLSIQLDIDADKSIHIAGSRYNFRPVVFIDVHPMHHPIISRQMLSGEIEALLYDSASPDVVTGFSLSLFRGIHTIDVTLADDVVILDDLGEPADAAALAVGQLVQIAGELEQDGQLVAQRVVIGEITVVPGIVASLVESDQFQLNPMCFFNRTNDGPVTVTLTADTVILVDGVEAGPDQIQVGQKACVSGKYDAETRELKAIAIFLRAPRIAGTLTALEPVQGGSQLTISQADVDTSVFLPEDVVPQVKGGRSLTVDELTALIACDPPRVQAVVAALPTEDTPAQAIGLEVMPQIVAATVAEVDANTRIITTRKGESIYVPDDAMLILHTGREQDDGALEDLNAGDQLWVVALKICDPADYSATVVIKVAPIELPCMPHLERIKMTVAELGDNTITSEDGTVIEVSDETMYIDRSQRPMRQMTFEDIVVGDVLDCDILVPCEDDGDPVQALVVTRVNPDSGDDDTPGHCSPDARPMEVTVESVSENAITTTDGEIIQVPEMTPIVQETDDGEAHLELADIEPDDQLRVFVVQSCEDDNLTAMWIVIVPPVPADSGDDAAR